MGPESEGRGAQRYVAGLGLTELGVGRKSETRWVRDHNPRLRRIEERRSHRCSSKPELSGAETARCLGAPRWGFGPVAAALFFGSCYEGVGAILGTCVGPTGPNTTLAPS